MRTKKVLFILMLPVVIEVIASCCDCLEIIYKNYSNQSIVINNLDNSGAEPIITSSNTIPKNAYGIKVGLHREIVACNRKNIQTFIQSAYATSCECPPPNQFLPKDSVTSFKILTLYDFDLNHSADSDISDYFKIYNQFSFITITDYLKSDKDYYSNSNLILYNENDLEIELDLLLMTAPSINITHKFKIQIVLSDGRILEQETSEIELI